MPTILVTGAAGFIGAATCARLLAEGHTVHGVDNLSYYYDVSLKEARLQHIAHDDFTFHKVDFSDRNAIAEVFQKAAPEYVIHLGAQASVRYALKAPENTQVYAKSNLLGHFNILDLCRDGYLAGKLKHLVYASTSSVYGANEKIPFEETDDVSRPQSLYAATKRGCEMMSYSYAHMYGMPQTAVRFFTVYGPWGRPDMSPMIFAKAILEDKPIPLFGHGELERDFTYIDDIVEGITRLMTHIPTQTETSAPHEIYNIGNHNPVKMLDFVKTMENVLGKEAILDLQDCPPTEVPKTYAETQKLRSAIGWAPNTSLEDGLIKFAAWYGQYAQNS